MQDKIIEYLENYDKAQDIISINDALGLTSSENLKLLQDELEKLVKSGIVHETKKKKYLLMKYCASLLTGKLSVAKNGYGFLIQDNGEEDNEEEIKNSI